jgi:hypothetical protein
MQEKGNRGFMVKTPKWSLILVLVCLITGVLFIFAGCGKKV